MIKTFTVSSKAQFLAALSCIRYNFQFDQTPSKIVLKRKDNKISEYIFGKSGYYMSEQIQPNPYRDLRSLYQKNGRIKEFTMTTRFYDGILNTIKEVKRISQNDLLK